MSFINEDRTIWELPTTTSVNLSDLVVLVNNGETKQASIEQLDGIGYQGTDLKDLSANWQSTFLSVAETSASWDSVYTNVYSNSANYILHNGNFRGQHLTIGTNDNFHLNFETVGTKRVIVLNTGEVGIGTLLPTEKLSVDGNLKVTGNSFLGDNCVDYTQIQGTLKLPCHSRNAIEFNNENTITGTPASDGAVIRYDANLFGPNLDGLLFEKTDVNNIPAGGGIAFRNRDFAGTTDEAFAIRGNGNVGIGTFSPNEKLTVHGNVEISNDSDPTFLRLRETQGSDAIWELRSYHTNLGSSGDQFSIYGGLQGSTLTDRFVITSSGDIGIGNINPTAKLDISGDVSITDKILHQGNFDTCIRFPSNSVFTVETNNIERLRVNSSGLTVVGNVSANGSIRGNNTPDWDSVFTTVQKVSSNWQSTYFTVNSLSASWQPLMVTCTDETSNLFVNPAGIYKFAMPYNMKLKEVRAFVSIPPVGGGTSPLKIDIRHNGSSIFDTIASVDKKLFINNSSNSSVGSFLPYVLKPAYTTGAGLLDNAIIDIVIEQVGTTTPGGGLKIVFK